jgi:hypothetical protein
MRLNMKKLGLMLGTTLLTSLISIALYAQDVTQTNDQAANTALNQANGYLSQLVQSTGSFLEQIANNTYGILRNVNNLPYYLGLMVTYMTQWTDEDKSSTTAALQGPLASLGTQLGSDLQAQMAMQSGLNASLFPANSNVANAASMQYSSLLNPASGNPSANPAQSPQYQYVLNASGINIPHTAPGATWKGKDALKYQSYYNTVMAAESFGGYILSGQYVDGNQFSTQQVALINQVSSSSWLSTVAGEYIGYVLRHILMFESQNFILLTQLVQTQKQMVTAQVITNALLINNNQLNESLLMSNAAGVPLQ